MDEALLDVENGRALQAEALTRDRGVPLRRDIVIFRNQYIYEQS
jgi:hypothetical protein